MRLESLSRRDDEDDVVDAVVALDDGEKVHVTFSVAHVGGISVASPDVPIFDRIGIETVRAFVTAVVAFDAVEVHHQDPDPS